MLKGRGGRTRRKSDDVGDDDEAVVEDGVGVPKRFSALSVTGSTLYLLCPDSVTSICWMYGTLDELYLLFEYMRSKYRRLI